MAKIKVILILGWDGPIGVERVLSFYPIRSLVVESVLSALFLPQRVAIQLIFALYIPATVPRYGLILKIVTFGHETCQKLHVMLSFYPIGSKLSLFLLYGQRFPRYWSIFRDIGQFSILPYLGMKLGHWPEVARILSFYPMGSKLSLFSLYGQRFPRYWSIFKNCHFGAWNLTIGQSCRSCTYSLSLPQGVEIELIFTLPVTVGEIKQFLTLITLIRYTN